MNRLRQYEPIMLSVLRIMAGLLFLAHGTQKFLSFPPGQAAGMGWSFSHPGHFAGIIEIVAGLLIALGLFTRPAAFLAFGTMAAAYFIGHAPRGFWPVNNGRRGDPLLLRLSLFRFRRAGAVEPRFEASPPID